MQKLLLSVKQYLTLFIWYNLILVVLTLSLLILIPYLFINWVLLIPIYYYNLPLYVSMENCLTNWLEYASFHSGNGMVVHEFGDDFNKLKSMLFLI